MLTSLDATADSKTAETLTALGSWVSALTGGGAAKAATTATKAAPGGAPTAEAETKIPKSLSGLFVAGSSILRPGLYRFDYDASGALTGLRQVAEFTGCGVLSPPEAAVLAGLLKAGSTDCPPIH